MQKQYRIIYRNKANYNRKESRNNFSFTCTDLWNAWTKIILFNSCMCLVPDLIYFDQLGPHKHYVHQMIGTQTHNNSMRFSITFMTLQLRKLSFWLILFIINLVTTMKISKLWWLISWSTRKKILLKADDMMLSSCTVPAVNFTPNHTLIGIQPWWMTCSSEMCSFFLCSTKKIWNEGGLAFIYFFS